MGLWAYIVALKIAMNGIIMNLITETMESFSLFRQLQYPKSAQILIACSPLRFMVVFWFGSTRLPSLHNTRVPLRSSVTFTVAVDVVDVPGTTSVTANSKG